VGVVIPSPPTTFAERVHEHHVRLGIVMGNCEACRKSDERPEWRKRLTARDNTGAILVGPRAT
jgi:hypothetical protein